MTSAMDDRSSWCACGWVVEAWRGRDGCSAPRQADQGESTTATLRGPRPGPTPSSSTPAVAWRPTRGRGRSIRVTDDIETVPAGIDADRVTTWFADHVVDVAPPLRFELIAGSLQPDLLGDRPRRPTLGAAPTTAAPGPGTAHDMGREHRIISALGPTDVPVPRRWGSAPTGRSTACRSPSWTSSTVGWSAVPRMRGAEPGPAPHRRRVARRRSGRHPRRRRRHAVGLGDLGRKDDYIARQLKRWYSQFQASGLPGRRRAGELPADRIHDIVAAAIPPAAGLGHRARRPPARQLHAGDDGSVKGGARLGDLCARRSAPRTSVCSGCTGPDPDQAAVLPQASPTALEGFPGKGRADRTVRRGLVAGPIAARLLHRLRVLEADLHHRRGLRPLRRGRHGRRADRSGAGFRSMLDALSDMTVTAADGIG